MQNTDDDAIIKTKQKNLAIVFNVPLIVWLLLQVLELSVSVMQLYPNPDQMDYIYIYIKLCILQQSLEVYHYKLLIISYRHSSWKWQDLKVTGLCQIWKLFS